jgi:hypothetical protein
MMTGKAKVPSDLVKTLNYKMPSRQQHKTIDHNRTSSSFIEGNLTELEPRGGKMSPLEVPADHTNKK